MSNHSPESTHYMTGPAVQRHLAISHMTLWRWMKDEALAFPKPSVTKRRNYFLKSEIEAWDQARRDASLQTAQAA